MKYIKAKKQSELTMTNRLREYQFLSLLTESDVIDKFGLFLSFYILQEVCFLFRILLSRRCLTCSKRFRVNQFLFRIPNSLKLMRKKVFSSKIWNKKHTPFYYHMHYFSMAKQSVQIMMILVRSFVPMIHISH